LPTLSYCAFENTSHDLEICVEKLMDAVDTRTADWSEYEAMALPDLVRQARTLVMLYDKFVTMKIEYVAEDDGGDY